MSDRRSWPHDLDGLQDLAKEEILPEWNEEVQRCDREYPTVEWLDNNGYSNLKWILDEKHDMNVPDFFSMIVGKRSPEPYWNIDDAKTIKWTEKFLTDKVETRRWRESTKSSLRSLLNSVFGQYSRVADDDSIIDLANDEDRATEAYENFKQVIKNIREEAATDNSAYRYLRAIQRLFEYLDRHHRIEYDPTDGLEDEFNFDLSSDGSTPLSPEQVGRLWREAEPLEEHLLIIGYVVWGVRTKELPSIHKSQFIFDGTDVLIEFEETDRKNGAGTVTLIFGVDYIIELFQRNSGKSEWGGHFLPSPGDPSKPMSGDTAKQRFERLAERADVKVDNETPTPTNGRATYWDLHFEASGMLIEEAGLFNQLQSVDDLETIVNYANDEKVERKRQQLFIQQFKKVLPDDAFDRGFVFLEDMRGQHRLDNFE